MVKLGNFKAEALFKLHPMTYSQTQISAWIRGLVSVALADQNFSNDERHLIEELEHEQFQGHANFAELETISPEELAKALGSDSKVKQNFLRTAVMVAMADGHYSETEDALIQQLCVALGEEITAMVELRTKLQSVNYLVGHEAHPSLLEPVKEWLDHLEIQDQKLARFLCKSIPSQCPFERDVVLFGHKIIHIPAMCKINPLYDQLVGLRFRALSYLADKCGEDISQYC